MKSYTDIEQSMKLSEILSIESADMYYHYDNDLAELESIPTIREEDDHFMLFPIDVMCWSLSALLEIIPSHLGEFKDGIDFGLSKSINGKWYSAHYLKTSEDGDISYVRTTTGDTAIDAVYEMIIWLKENKHI